MKAKFLYIALLIGLVACSDNFINDIEGEIPGDIEEHHSFSPTEQKELLDKVAKDYFAYFWNECHPVSKMARIGSDRSLTTVALAGSAYALTAIPVAVERGWITRAEGAERVLTVCRFLKNTAERYHGAWSHWMDGQTGVGLPFSSPTQQSAGDLVETAFMMMALLVCSEYFDKQSEDEEEMRQLVDHFWNTIEWKFYTNNKNVLHWAWDRNMGFAPLKISGPNEALPVYILAMAAPQNNAITQQVYTLGWQGGSSYYNAGRQTYGYTFELGGNEQGGPLFITQHPFLWLNPFELRDQHVDYWEFYTNHALINRHYCLQKALKVYGYSEERWGLSACYGPLGKDYKGRSPSKDDGVIATTSSMGAIDAVPYYALQATAGMMKEKKLIGKYGIVDAYSKIDNWYDTRYLSISIMPVVGIIENYRSGLIWNLAMKNEKIKNGLMLCGFTKATYKDGFSQLPVDMVDGTVDLVSNPDTQKYSLRFFLNKASSNVTVKLANKGKEYSETLSGIQQGMTTCEFDYESVMKLTYEAQLYVDNRLISTQKIRLR